ncbi:MAG: hypothetical protein R3A48_27400 [Polyangiales bacterium]
MTQSLSHPLWTAEPFTAGIGERGVDDLVVSLDRRFVAVIESGYDHEDRGVRGEVVVLRCVDGVELFRAEHRSWAPLGAWSVDGFTLRDGGGDAEPIAWSPTDEAPAASVARCSAGRLRVRREADDRVCLEGPSGEALFEVFTDAYEEISALALSGDEAVWAAACSGPRPPDAKRPRGGAWNVGYVARGGEASLTLPLDRCTLSVALSHRGDLLAGVCDGELRVHRTSNGERLASGAEGYATRVAFAADDALVVASRGPGGLSRESPCFVRAFALGQDR